jgi:dephospho-CoA kinase
MLKVGITGGIGSGKTTACRMFEALGIPVYYADERGKYLLEHDEALINEIKKTFGEEVYADGVLNRKLVAAKVFNDKTKLEQLNALVHPAVFLDLQSWLQDKEEQDYPYVLNEAALLVETGSYKALDKLIVVTAPLNVRINRIKTRDTIGEEEIISRVKNQLPEEEKVKLADYVLTNDMDLEHLNKQVIEIHEQLLLLQPKKKNE